MPARFLSFRSRGVALKVLASPRLIASLVIVTCALALPATGTRAYIGNDPYIITLKANPPGDVTCTDTVLVTATVRAADTGNPQQGQAIHWEFKTAQSTQDVMSPATSVTDNNGKTSSTVHFGPAEGQRTVRVYAIPDFPETINVSCHGGLPSPTPSPTRSPTPSPTPRVTPSPTSTATAGGSSTPTPAGSGVPSPSGPPLPTTSELPGASPTSALSTTASAASPTASDFPAGSGSIASAGSPGPSASPAVTPGDQPGSSATGDLALPGALLILLVLLVGGSAAFMYTRRH